MSVSTYAHVSTYWFLRRVEILRVDNEMFTSGSVWPFLCIECCTLSAVWQQCAVLAFDWPWLAGCSIVVFPPSHLTYLPFSHITFSFLQSHLTSYPPSLPSSLPPIYLSHLPSLQSISPIFLPPISPCLLPSLLPPSHPVSIASIFLRTRAIMRWRRSFDLRSRTQKGLKELIRQHKWQKIKAPIIYIYIHIYLESCQLFEVYSLYCLYQLRWTTYLTFCALFHFWVRSNLIIES